MYIIRRIIATPRVVVVRSRKSVLRHIIDGFATIAGVIAGIVCSGLILLLAIYLLAALTA